MVGSVELKCAGCGSAQVKFVEHGAVAECRFCGSRVAVPPELRPKAPAAQVAESVVAALDQARRAAEAQAESAAPSVAAPPARSSEGSPVLGCLAAAVIGLVVFGGGAFLSTRQEQAEQRKRDLPVPLFERRLSAALPREVRYAGLVLTVREGVISNRRPNEPEDRLRTSASEAYATLKTSIRNPLAGEAPLLDNALRLQLADGRACPVANEPMIQVAAQSTRDTALVFTVPFGAEWQGAKLVISEKNREPAELALDGPVPAVAPPVSLPITGEARVVNGEWDDATYRILGGSLDLDSHGKRAEQGKRFLTLQVRVTNNSTSAGGMGLGSDDFRIVAEGVSIAPDECPIELVPATSFKDVEVVFALPTHVTNCELQVGPVSRQNLRIPLSLGGGQAAEG